MSAFYELHYCFGVKPPEKTYAFKRILDGIQRAQKRKPKKQLAIHWRELKQMLRLLGSSTYKKRLIQANWVFQFFMCIRGGSCTAKRQQRTQSSRTLKIKHLVWELNEHNRLRAVYFELPGEKNDSMNKGRGMYREILDNENICPIKFLERMLLDRYSSMKEAIKHRNAYLFELKPRHVLTLAISNREIKNITAALGWDSARYASHSIRKGAATTLKGNGRGVEEIKLMANWSSEAIYRYLLEDRQWQLEMAKAFTQKVPKEQQLPEPKRGKKRLCYKYQRQIKR